MNDSADIVADALALPGAVERLRSLGGKPADYLNTCHELALLLFAQGEHAAMRTMLDEYGRAFRSRPVVVRCPYVFGRIGEAAAVFGALAHLRRIGRLDVLPVLLADHGACNPAYIKHWARHFDIHVTEETVRERYGEAPTLRVGFLPSPEGEFIPCGDSYALARQMDGGGPLLTLSDAETDRGRTALADLGMPGDAWFVCLHARSAAYMSDAGVDDRHNTHRNSDIRSFAGAAQRIADRGGWIVRIGASGTAPLPAWPNTIDLPHRRPWADWLDVFALGGCRFFLGDSSGPVAVAATFGRPIVAVNLQLGSPSTWMDLHIPKLYRRDGRLLTISEAIEAGLLMRQRPLPEGIEAVDNTAEDIETAVSEYLDGWSDPERQDGYVVAHPPEIARLLGAASPAFLERHEGLMR